MSVFRFPCSEKLFAVAFWGVSRMLLENLNKMTFRAEAQTFRNFDTGMVRIFKHILCGFDTLFGYVIGNCDSDFLVEKLGYIGRTHGGDLCQFVEGDSGMEIVVDVVETKYHRFGVNVCLVNNLHSLGVIFHDLMVKKIDFIFCSALVDALDINIAEIISRLHFHSSLYAVARNKGNGNYQMILEISEAIGAESAHLFAVKRLEKLSDILGSAFLDTVEKGHFSLVG